MNHSITYREMFNDVSSTLLALRLAAPEVTGSEEKNAQRSSSCVDPDTKSCAAVYALTGQPQLPSLVECHAKPVLYEPSYSQMTSKPSSSTTKRQLKNTANSVGSPLSSIDEAMKHTILSQKRPKPKSSPAASVLATIEEHGSMTGDDGKSGSNRDEDGEEHSFSGATDSRRQGASSCQLTPIESSSDVVANRDSSLSINTYCTINTVNSYEAMPSTDSGFASRNSQVSQYEWIIRSDSKSRSDEQASSLHRCRWSAEEEEEEDQHDGGVFDPQYDPLSPRYCETLLPLDGTYEPLKKPDYPATISTTHPGTQSQQIELQNRIKADANPKRNTVSLG